MKPSNRVDEKIVKGRKYESLFSRRFLIDGELKTVKCLNVQLEFNVGFGGFEKAYSREPASRLIYTVKLQNPILTGG
jgi:hypothetical protein